MLKCDLMKNGECICNQKCYKLIAYEEGYKDGYKDGTENIITNIFDEDNVIVTQKREKERLIKTEKRLVEQLVKGAEMNKETTIDNWVNFFKFEVCSTCKFYNKDFDVCGGEMLPMERAIMKNLEGRGNCRDIKEFAERLKAGVKNEN